MQWTKLRSSQFTHKKYSDILSALHLLDKDLIGNLPRLLSGELALLGLTLDPTENMLTSAKAAIEETSRRIESEVLQFSLAEVRSMLNESFLTLFHQEFLGEQRELFYVDKIINPAFEGRLIRKTSHAGRRGSTDDC